MTDPQDRFQQLVSKLREHEYRLTPQRVELVRLIAVSEGHPSASQIYQQIKTQFPTMSLATVYKTLDLLKELGEVLEIDLRDDSHYDGNKPYPHPHLICTNCQTIMDGELDAAVKKIVQEVEKNFGFQIIKHQLDFYGICPDCQNNS
jgi:Fur family transcriptional regulator, peroxide stress response regulator